MDLLVTVGRATPITRLLKRILHLSDLHFGYERSALDSALSRQVVPALRPDLNRRER